LTDSIGPSNRQKLGRDSLRIGLIQGSGGVHLVQKGLIALEPRRKRFAPLKKETPSKHTGDGPVRPYKVLDSRLFVKQEKTGPASPHAALFPGLFVFNAAFR